MATRYFVGTGNRNWNDISNWSDSSGGVGGASVPTSSDNVFFDNNSGTGTITVNAIASMLDFDVTGLAQNITLANAAYTFNVYGSAYLSTYLIWNFTGTGYFYLNKDIKTNGSIVKCNVLYFGALVQGSIHNLLDDLNLSTSNIKTDAIFGGLTEVVNTNGFNITANAWSQTYCNLNLSSSIINLSGYFGIYSYGLINAGTSTIICNGIPGNANVSANLYNVIINKKTYNFAGTGTGSFTFENLTLNGGPNTVTNENLFLIGRDVVINNTLTLNGYNSTNFRMILYSSSIGTPRTITCNGTIVASNVDFRDITLAGTANRDLSNITGGSGDCGGNSGIIFTPPQTQYFKHTGGGTVLWSDTTKWFSDIVMTIAGRVPLPQDDAKFIAGSFSQSATLSVNVPRIGGLDMENINQLITISRTVAVRVHKNFILHPSILWGADSGYYWRFLTDNNSIIKFENTNYPQQTEFLIGTFNFGSDFKAGTIYNSATIYSNDYNISVGTLSSTGLANFYAGSSFIQISNTANESASPLYINQSFYSGTSTIKVSLIGTQNSNLLLVNTTLNRLWISGTHTGFYIIQPDYNNYINELIIDAGRKLSLKNGRTQTINKLTALGTQSQPITIGSMTPGSKYTLNLTGSTYVETDYINISDANVTQPNKFYAGINSINGGNNTNVNFSYITLPLNMNLYTIKMYDRVLTDSEVLQNFNSIKTRYGL